MIWDDQMYSSWNHKLICGWGSFWLMSMVLVVLEMAHVTWIWLLKELQE